MMKRMDVSRWLLLVMLGMSASTTGFAVEAGEQIEYRKSVMKTLDEEMAAYRSAAELNAPPAVLAKHLKSLAMTSGQIKKAFEPRVEGGRAKGDIWKKWPDFMKRAESQALKLQQLSESAGAAGATAASIDLKSALGCSGCHEAYRNPLASGSPEVRTAGANPIDYRKQIMRSIDAQTSAIGQILSGTISDENFASHLEVVSINAGLANTAFERVAQGGDALPKVWQDHAKFLRTMQEFSDNAAKAAKIARQDGKDAATVAVIDALPCRQCHEVYRRK